MPNLKLTLITHRLVGIDEMKKAISLPFEICSCTLFAEGVSTNFPTLLEQPEDLAHLDQAIEEGKIVSVEGLAVGEHYSGYHVKKTSTGRYVSTVWVEAGAVQQKSRFYDTVADWIALHATSWEMIIAAIGEKSRIDDVEGDVEHILQESHGVDRWFFPGRRNSRIHNLIRSYLDGEYDTSVFCDEFYFMYDIGGLPVADEEREILRELSTVASFYSPYPEDDGIYRGYTDEEEVRATAERVWIALRDLRL